jgi:hypothetical protein
MFAEQEHPRAFMDRDVARKLCNWLMSKRSVKTAVPVTVQIGRRLYPAARYRERQRKGLMEERLYVIGEMPPLQNRLKRACYRTDFSDDGWHLVAWVRVKQSSSELREVCPFGTHFVLVFQTELENWAYEQCQGKRLHRIPMTITEIGGPVNQATEEKQDDRC